MHRKLIFAFWMLTTVFAKGPAWHPYDNIAIPSGLLKTAAGHRDPGTFVLDPLFLTKSVLNAGETALLLPVLSKLKHRQCITVTAIGGSNTCGHGNFHPGDAPKGQKDSWAAEFQKLLIKHFPCEAEGHKVRIRCGGGWGTNVWMRSPETKRYAAASDLVLMETGVNDVTELDLAEKQTGNRSNGILPIQQMTEILINILLSVPNHPAIMYLGFPTLGCYDRQYPRLCEGIHTQLPVTRYYGIPHVSLRDAMDPVLGERRAWNRVMFHTDNIHATKLSHRISAHLILHLLLLHLQSLAVATYPQIPYEPRELLMITQANLTRYLNDTSLHVPLIKETPYLLKQEGFEVKEDVPGKLGLITEAASAHTSYLFPWPVVEKHMKEGTVEILSLKSYKNVGCYTVTVASATSTTSNDCNLSQQNVLAKTKVDCQWQIQRSIPTSDSISISIKRAANKCLLVNFTAISCRLSTKVKLLKLTLV